MVDRDEEYGQIGRRTDDDGTGEWLTLQSWLSATVGVHARLIGLGRSKLDIVKPKDLTSSSPRRA